MNEKGTSTARLLFGDAPEMRVTSRPEPVPVELRRSWRVATVVLILASSRANRASREKVLLLNYALMNPNTQDSLVEVLSGTESPFFLQVRVDPAVGRAADFAIGLGLATRVAGSSLELTGAGVQLADAFSADDTLLTREKSFLERVRRIATEGRVREVLRWR